MNEESMSNIDSSLRREDDSLQAVITAGIYNRPIIILEDIRVYLIGNWMDKDETLQVDGRSGKSDGDPVELSAESFSAYSR